MMRVPFFRILLLSIISLPALPAQQYTLEPLTVPGWILTSLKGINNRGALVGAYNKQAFGALRGFKRDANGVFEFPINDPDSNNYTFPFAINDSGVIVGYYYDAAFVAHGFILTGGPRGTFTTYGRVIGGINNRGDFAGTDDQAGFLNVGGAVTRFSFPGGSTEVWGIAWDRTVIGSSYNSDITFGFIRGRNGNFAGFQVANAFLTIPQAINNEAGKIVGYYEDQSGTHGFVYDYVADLSRLESATVGTVLTVPVQTIEYPGTQGRTLVTCINAQGKIGDYTENGISFTGTPQP